MDLDDQIDCFVFDFGGTLSSAPYFLVVPEQCSNWRALFDQYVFGDGDLFDRWMTGQVSARDIAEMMAGHTQMAVSDVLLWMEKGLRDLPLNRAVDQLAIAAKKRGKKTILVTGNIDLFSTVVVPDLKLEDKFDVIVNSADYGELRKRVTWPIAFEKVGGSVGYNNSFLIEDSFSNVELFRKLGGVAYHYRSDEGLLVWLDDVGFVL
ncbi:MAG: hypothetical protein HOE48_23700 [Candidatus Latescibacteria bacterium]|jgi:FMN phosphatase YigB (HAD superfamily)|nr:hypothetical protein [Candidatus Latescibacterota bacterium]MBT4140934.1 hypothetical protein [Candidatus Latescibacterota bacterium]MBT5832283.1 hypothetical protein [Candidatus Latescibacterota bacterium]